MIWGVALQVQRVVVIDHNVGPSTPISRALIQEELPSLLHTCHESRQLALTKYQSPFGRSWRYNKSRKSADLKKVLKTLGLAQRGTIALMLVRLEEYMNSHHEDSDRFEHLAELTDIPYPSIIAPLWFDLKDDILLVKVPGLEAGRNYWLGSSLLSLSNSREIDKVQNLALELDRVDANGQYYHYQRLWTEIISTTPFNGFTSLRCLSLLLRDNCEVVILKLDDKNILVSGQWAFSLDLEAQDFKQEMGDQWSGVTWRVILARDGESSLWELANAWKPNSQLWEQDKREICENEPRVATIWGTAERVRSRPPGEYRPLVGRKALLLEDGDGRTYLGP